MKQVIFNVGGALSSYTEFSGKKLMIDIGKSSDFNPVSDFLLPLYQRLNYEKSSYNSDKYLIDQLLISHPHNDHISAIKEFNDDFHPDLLTCPNDNDGMKEEHKVNWVLFEENPNIDILKKMLIGRQPPLRATSDQNEFIYYIPPKIVENTDDLKNESYANNISIVVFLIINSHRVFFPGDLQKNGMTEIINRNYCLKNKLKGGVDILITPHHGLRSSFSTELFNNIKNNKTRCLNIVSEKINSDDNREVDTRYSSADYCSGDNNLGDKNNPSYQVKTSRGHLLIDYSKNDKPYIEIINDKDEIIEKFIEL